MQKVKLLTSMPPTSRQDQQFVETIGSLSTVDQTKPVTAKSWPLVAQKANGHIQ